MPLIPLLVSLLLAVLVIFALIWAIQRLAVAFEIPAQIVVVLQVLIVLAGVLWLARAFSSVRF
jgi:hypothetical protein